MDGRATVSPEAAAKHLGTLLASLPDGVIAISVARSSLLPACSLHVHVRPGDAGRLSEGFTFDTTGDSLAECVAALRESHPHLERKNGRT